MYPASRMPDLTIPSAIWRTIWSLTRLLKLFQLFQPIGGVLARPLDFTGAGIVKETGAGLGGRGFGTAVEPRASSKTGGGRGARPGAAPGPGPGVAAPAPGTAPGPAMIAAPGVAPGAPGAPPGPRPGPRPPPPIGIVSFSLSPSRTAVYVTFCIAPARPARSASSVILPSSILPSTMVSWERPMMYPVIFPSAPWLRATTISRPLSVVEALPVQRPVSV